MDAHEFWLLLLGLGIILTLARVLGELAQKLGQPAVLGEMLVGILLGPTVLGVAAPWLNHLLFPLDGPRAIVMEGLSQLAVVLFLLVVGMEVDLSTVWRQGKSALSVGVLGFVVPFGLAFVVAWGAPGVLYAEDGPSLPAFALFFATAMSISAVPVVSKILMDLGLYRTDMGMVILSAAIFTDLAGWILFAVILGMVGVQPGLGGSVGHVIGMTLLFVVFMLTAGRWVIDRLLPWLQAHTKWPGGVLGFALSLSLISAACTEVIGVHAVLGAFLVGVAIGDSAHLREQTRAIIREFISFMFAPLFFASIGLRMNFLANFDAGLVLAVLLVACAGKLGGCTLGARLGGMTPRESWAVGLGMNARGLMEIILGSVALEFGIIGEPMFEALVVMALVTALIPGPAMQFILKRRKRLGVADVLSAKAFAGELRALDRYEAIRELSDRVAEATALEPSGIAEAVWRRERMMATGIGRGVAVPHARLPQLDHPIVGIGISPSGLDFDAPDGEAVHVVFLVLTPQKDNGAQLEILADIARTCSEPRFLENVGRVENYTQFLALIRTTAPSES